MRCFLCTPVTNDSLHCKTLDELLRILPSSSMCIGASAASKHTEWVVSFGKCQQAEKLDELLGKRGIGIDKVLNFDVPDSTLVRSLALSPKVLLPLPPHDLLHAAGLKLLDASKVYVNMGLNSCGIQANAKAQAALKLETSLSQSIKGLWDQCLCTTA